MNSKWQEEYQKKLNLPLPSFDGKKRYAQQDCSDTDTRCRRDDDPDGGTAHCDRVWCGHAEGEDPQAACQRVDRRCPPGFSW
jgi:hypothetical protein